MAVRQTFILTWNPTLPSAWPGGDYQDAIQATASGDRALRQWSTGVRRQGVNVGDRAFMLRQHQERGIVARGLFTSEIRMAPRWDDPRRAGPQADVEWDQVVDPMQRLPIEDLKDRVPEVPWDRLQAPGVKVLPPAAAKIERMWAKHSGQTVFQSPEELSAFLEGRRVHVELDRFERSPQVRGSCLAHWGYRCTVCDIDFEEFYGELGHGFIHVHHLRPLSEVGAEHKVDPVRDLRPVCPNCHSMLHKRQPPLSIEDLRELLRTR